MAKSLLCLTGVFFVFYGAAFTFFPAEMATLVTGDGPDTASGIIDLRATYGGMSISVGVIILILAAHGDNLSLALLVTAIVLLAMAAGRVLGIILDGSPNAIMYVYLAAELAVSGIALWLRSSAVDSG